MFVGPTLECYDTLLRESTDLEYVGTRLHGAIRAMQHKKRAVIVAVDNRAIEKKRDFNFHVVERSKIGTLEDDICRSFKTKIDLPEREIRLFLSQFEGNDE